MRRIDQHPGALKRRIDDNQFILRLFGTTNANAYIRAVHIETQDWS